MTVRLLTTEEVAGCFRTSPSTVRYWRHIGVGPVSIRVDRGVLYEVECDRYGAVSASRPSGRGMRAV